MHTGTRTSAVGSMATLYRARGCQRSYCACSACPIASTAAGHARHVRAASHPHSHPQPPVQAHYAYRPTKSMCMEKGG
jgi:hypothetical protein